ncbi:ThuA domain-containing protein [Lacipirellula sp.]|uniref:ThuA domain-containing protein n=1 Tax=Lacipirellula sp. TaxID=2691419 RepID=UPI003D0C0BD1
MLLHRWFLVACAVVVAGVSARAGCAAEAADAEDERPHVVFVTGDDEYSSELSMPMIAAILEKHHGIKTTVLYAVNEKGERDRHGNSIPGLEALRDADLAVFYMRFRQLPQEQLDEIVKFAESGKPLIGLRTSSHAFNYAEAPRDRWNAEFPMKYFGHKWISHYGHGNSTEAHVVESEAKADNPILRGVSSPEWLNSWLYVVNEGDVKLPEDCTVLMVGDATKGTEPGGEKFGNREPMTWTRELPLKDGGVQRVFFTSLGHPRDFLKEGPRRLLVNAILWGLGREASIPAEGANVEIVGEYVPPDPH